MPAAIRCRASTTRLPASARHGVHRHALQRRLLRALPPSTWPSAAAISVEHPIPQPRATSCSTTLAEIAVGVQWLATGRRSAGADGQPGGGSLMAAYHCRRGPVIRPTATQAAAGGELVAARRPVRVPRRPPAAPRSSRTGWISGVDERDHPRRSRAVCPPNVVPFEPEFVSATAPPSARNVGITAFCHAEPTVSPSSASTTRSSMFRTWADLRMVDPTLDPSNRRPNWCYAAFPRPLTRRCSASAWPAPAAPGSTCGASPIPTAVPSHLPRLDIPTLLVQLDADAGVFLSQADAIFEQMPPLTRSTSLPGDHYFEEPAGARDVVPTPLPSGRRH